MSQPPDHYERIFDFTDFSAMQPNAQQPGQKIDQELNAARESVNDTIDRLNEIQRDDGKVKASALDTTEFTGIVNAATTTATNAAASATASASTATTKASEATASATTASNAATSATGASALATAQAGLATTAATTATTKATEASNSAASALASQTSATASAATATTKAAEASGSAATATTQASNAAISASTATAQGNLATAAAVSAGNSASSASTSAISASNSASAAASSASAAAASAASIMALDPVEEAPINGIQYSRKDGNWTAAIIGDKYYSISATSLSVSNGTKTLTIATGLSYTTQQSVIVAYDATHHMHGTVTSYNSSTGVIVVDVTQHTGSGTYSLWTVNVGGISSTAEWGLITGTLSAQTDLQAALDAKLAVTTAALTYAPLASPTFTGTVTIPSGASISGYLTSATAASTYQTQAGMSSYLTTATASSIYLAKSDNLASLTSASTARTNLGLTSLATASFSTNAQAVAGTSATTAMTPASAYWADKRSGHSFVQFVSMAASTSGTGAGASLSVGGYVVGAPTTSSGYGLGNFYYAGAQRGINRGNGSWNWSKPFSASFRYSRNNAPSDSNSISRVTFGKAAGTAGDPTTHSVGIRMLGSGALQLIVHNGTTLTPVTTTSSIVPTQSLTVDIRITSDGAGNVSLYFNDVLEATTSAGPTGTSGTSGAAYFVLEAQNTTTITGSPAAHSVYNLHFDFAD